MKVPSRSILASIGAVACGFLPTMSLADELDMTTLLPVYNSSSFTQSVTPNLLTITSYSGLPGSQFYFAQNLTPFSISGNFEAVVTASATQSVGAQFQAILNNGTGSWVGGFLFGPSYYANYGYNSGFVNTPSTPDPSSTATLEIERIGDIVDVYASTGAGFTKLLSLNGSNLSGPVQLNLQEDVQGGQPTSQTVTYTNFYVVNNPGAHLTDFTGGTADDPIPLPSSTVSSITGDIGGTGTPNSDFYSFYWKGGSFEASVGVTNAAELTPQPTFEFELCAGTSCSVATADAADDWAASLMIADLSPGTYTLGIIDETPSPDPTFTIAFGTPISQTLGVVPEPSTWAMMLAGFAGLGFMSYRASRKSAAA
jgi:hypothetical protein